MIFSASFACAALLIIWTYFHLAEIEKTKISNSLAQSAISVESSFIDRIDRTFAIIQNINFQITQKPS